MPASTTHGNLHTLSGYPSPVEKGGVMGEQETFLSECGSPSGLFSLLFPFFPFVCHKYDIHSIAQKEGTKTQQPSLQGHVFPLC